MITTGILAPDFSLYDSDKNLIALKDYRHKKNVLLLFFPLAFTSTCTVELCSVRDNLPFYGNENTEVFGISVDSVYCLNAYKKQYKLNYPLLSDFNKQVSKSYEILYEVFSAMQMEGVGKRAAFIIDKEGIIRYSEVLENASLVPDFTQIGNVLQYLR